MSLFRCTIKFVSRIPQHPTYLSRTLNYHRLWRLCSSSSHAVLSDPADPLPDGWDKVYPPKIKNIVSEIANLTLLEVADLNECLKKTLNIKDAPMMMGAAIAAAPAAASEEEEAPQVTKSSFTVKLMKFEESKKVAVIKEIKNQIDGMNLVQAKKFVESAPQIIKADIAKDEAEKLKQVLEAVGATCEIS